MIEVGNIIKNLIPTEAVVVNKIQKLGTMYSLKFTGVNTNKSSSKVITEEQFSSLEVLTSDGEFNFKGDPYKFVLFAEAERINLWGIERSGFFNGREKWAKGFENQRV